MQEIKDLRKILKERERRTGNGEQSPPSGKGGGVKGSGVEGGLISLDNHGQLLTI